jgi:predicted transcriptional regulator YheO
MLQEHELDALRKLAKGVAAQFGSGCEVVVHELTEKSAYNSIVAIENGHVTGRKIGDGPSHVVLEQLGKSIDAEKAEDHFCYMTKTPDGKILKSSTVYIRDQEGKVAALFCINFDISALLMVDNALGELVAFKDQNQKTPERITQNVSDLLDDLIEQSVAMVGKPVALMTKEDKVRAIQFLNQNGALLITKSGDKIAKHFGISKYTLYSYLDVKTGGDNHD